MFCNISPLFIFFVAGEDYTDTRVPFTLQGGGIMEIFSVDIPILHNGEIEGNEDFMTRIVADPLPERIDLDPDQGTVIITDVPLEPSLTIVEPSPSRMLITIFDPQKWYI